MDISLASDNTILYWDEHLAALDTQRWSVTFEQVADVFAEHLCRVDLGAGREERWGNVGDPESGFVLFVVVVEPEGDGWRVVAVFPATQRKPPERKPELDFPG